MSNGISNSYMKSKLLFIFLFFFGILPASVVADRILKISSFSTCLANPAVVLNYVDIEYNQDSQNVTFNVSGTSGEVQNITAVLNVTALGNTVYSNEFNPCAKSNFIAQLCPGIFSAAGTQEIPSSYASLVPSEAFNIPDIPAYATLQLKSLDTGKDVACIQSDLSNGKSVDSTIVMIVAAGIIGAALVVSVISALVAAAGGGQVASNTSPGITEVLQWFQGVAMNGMLSVNYPSVYRSFTKNFAFSTGIIPSTIIQSWLDDFRAATGGNITNNNVQFLQNAMLDFSDDTTTNGNPSLKRRLTEVIVNGRDIATTIGFTDGNSTNPNAAKAIVHVSGIQAYVEQLAVPGSNTFLTMLLVVSIIIAAIIVGILLFKVILETWALCGSFPQSLRGFRKHYWGTIARAIVNLILLFQSVWILYCLFQFTHHDSWAATVLAGVTLAVVMGVLIFYAISIHRTARKLKKLEGHAWALYDDKKIWLKYGLFYDCYKKTYWWFFIPGIVYAFSKGCVLAALDGHGFAQTVGLVVIEILMLALLLWDRPYERRSGNIINISIQVIRVISMVCVLLFVQELGMTQTTQSILGFALVIVQSVVTVIIALLIVINAFIVCCKTNPHRQRRKAAEKFRHDSQDLNSLLPLNSHHSLYAAPVVMPTNTPRYSNSNTELKAPVAYVRVDTRDILPPASTAMSTNANGHYSYVAGMANANHHFSAPVPDPRTSIAYAPVDRGLGSH